MKGMSNEQTGID